MSLYNINRKSTWTHLRASIQITINCNCIWIFCMSWIVSVLTVKRTYSIFIVTMYLAVRSSSKILKNIWSRRPASMSWIIWQLSTIKLTMVPVSKWGMKQKYISLNTKLHWCIHEHWWPMKNLHILTLLKMIGWSAKRQHSSSHWKLIRNRQEHSCQVT